MDSSYWYYILILLIFIFLIVSACLIVISGRPDTSVKRRGSHSKNQYNLIWKTNFSGPIEQSGKFDYVRWAVPTTEPIKCQELGYYTNNKRNLRLIQSYDILNRVNKNHSLVLAVTPDSVTIKDVKGDRHYPYSTTRIISTASFLTGFFIVKVRIPYQSNGIWPYIRLIAPEDSDQNITNVSPCSDNAIYMFKPLYYCDDALQWTVGSTGCGFETSRNDHEQVWSIDSCATISIGLEWTHQYLKWYLNPKMGLNGRPSGKIMYTENLPPTLTQSNKLSPRHLELGIAVGGNQFNHQNHPAIESEEEKMIVEEIDVYQEITY